MGGERLGGGAGKAGPISTSETVYARLVIAGPAEEAAFGEALGGLLPDLESCGNGGRSLGDEPGFYGEGSEQLMCANCRRGAPQQVRATARALERGFRGLSLGAWISAGPAAPECKELRRFLEEVVESHIGKKLVTRSLLAGET